MPEWLVPLFFGSATVIAFGWYVLCVEVASRRFPDDHHEHGPFDQ